jgi:hypothetical protein
VFRTPKKIQKLNQQRTMSAGYHTHGGEHKVVADLVAAAEAIVGIDSGARAYKEHQQHNDTKSVHTFSESERGHIQPVLHNNTNGREASSCPASCVVQNREA